MRQNQCIIYFIVVFILWLVLIDFFLSYYSSNRYASDRLANDLHGLEKTIASQQVESDQLLNDVRIVVQQKKGLHHAGRSRIEVVPQGPPPSPPSEFVPPSPLPYPHIERDDNAIAILLFSCNRLTVSRSLDQLIKYRPSKRRFPIIVSQDCVHEPTTRVIQSYHDQVYLFQQPDQSDIPVPPKEKKFRGYFRIARHYKWALNFTFCHLNFSTVVVVEDDLDVSPDFYEYFAATLPVLQADPSLWCVSAWNDNGKPELVDRQAADLLYRTDFFPGLGWMLTKNLWLELMPKWPLSYWDDWMREPAQRKGRSCIRPELSRTKTFGKIGVSNGMYFDKHLKYIYLNEKFVEFTKQNMTYLRKEVYDANFFNVVYGSPIVSYHELKNGQVFASGSVRILYDNKQTLKKMTKAVGLMDDFRGGVPRTAYKGVISFVYGNRRVFMTPSSTFKGYEPN